MNVSKSSIQMPNHDEIIRRLNTVDNQRHPNESFYPAIADALADSEVVPMGLVNHLILAAADYQEDLSESAQAMVPLSMTNYIVALVDDEKLRTKALAILAQVQE